MEFVDGETLANRIDRGPVPVDEGLGITRQLANALEAAHDQGIIHCDLKHDGPQVRATAEPCAGCDAIPKSE
jgi:serine/threonine-protein kinase